MNTHPRATLHMANGSKIVIELLPEAAPNTVNSFIYAASRGFMDHHAIQRIVPGGRDVPGIWTQGVPVSDSE